MTASDTGRCIECEEIELARVRDQRPIGSLAIPASALLGFPEGTDPRSLTRRRLLREGVLGMASVYAATRLPWEAIWEAATAEAAANDRCLVLLYLAGGQDGLNVVVPIDAGQHTAYATARPTLHRGLGPTAGGRVGSWAMPGTSGALALANVAVSTASGGDSGVADQGLDALWTSGDPTDPAAGLAIMPAADYTPANLSHFSSSDYWFAGALKGMSTGWIGRWLDRYGSRTNPLQAISIDSALSKAIRTTSAPVCAISSLAAVGFPLDGRNHAYPPPGGADLTGIDAVAALAGLASVTPRPANAHLARARSTYGLATDVIGDLAALGTPSAAAGYPTGSRLATKLRLAAQLLQADLGTRVITVHWGAFDTHTNELTRQDPQITELARCLTAFRADLATRGVEKKVATLVFSECRRVRENAAAGTDHGAGGLMMLSGSGVRGGLASPPPSVTDLDGRGNVRVQTDFRAVYREVLAHWLGGDPAAVLPGEAQIPALRRADGSSSLFRP